MAGILSGGMRTRIDGTVSPNLAKIDQLFVEDASERDWCSDSIATIRLNWLQVVDLWPTATVVDYDEQRLKLNHVGNCLDQIIFQCASLTISPRVNDILANLRVGQPLDWDFAFGSELPIDRDLRTRLLQELAQEGAVLEAGVVDVEQGLIYKVAKSRKVQALSAVVLAVVLVGCAIFLPLGLSWIGTLTDQWPLGPADLSRLYASYILILIGSGVHVLIDALKAARAQTKPSFQALNDWVLWIHVRLTSILWGLAWVNLGYVLIMFGIPELQWQAAFFAGYSIDSVTTLFLGRFEATVKTKTQEITSQSNKPEPEVGTVR